MSLPLLPLSSKLTSQSSNQSSPKPKVTRQPNKKVPAFLNKLFSILSDEKYRQVISWKDDGESFVGMRIHL